MKLKFNILHKITFVIATLMAINSIVFLFIDDFIEKAPILILGAALLFFHALFSSAYQLAEKLYDEKQASRTQSPDNDDKQG